MMTRVMVALMFLTSAASGATYAEEIWGYLENENDTLAIRGLKMTAELSDEEALEFLLYAVALQKPRVAMEAGEILAERQIPGAFDELAEMLDIEDKNTYGAVSVALMGYPADGYINKVEALLEADSPKRRLFAVKYVSDSGVDEEVEILKGLLSDPEETVRLAAVNALKDEDVDVVPAALTLFNSEKTAIVVGAVEAVKDKQDTRVFEPLLGLLTHKFANVVQPAGEALAEYEGEEYVERFIELSADEDHRLRTFAVRRLAASGEERVIPVIIERLDDKNISVMLAAINGLTRINYKEIGERFKEILANVDYADEVRFAAMRGLAEMQVEGSEVVIAEVMNNSGEMDILRKNAAVALSFFHNDFAFGILYDEVETRDAGSPTIRPSIRGLGLMGDARALPLLEDLTVEPDDRSEFYGSAVTAIGLIGGSDAYEFLYEEYSENGVKDSPYNAVLPYALAICDDERGPRLVMEELVRIYEENDTVGTENDETVVFRRMAVTGLSDSGFGEAGDVIVLALKDRDESVVIAALKAAANLFGPDMIPLLENDKKLNSGKTRLYAERAVKAIKKRYGILNE
jgi:HEAT repeat protein